MLVDYGIQVAMNYISANANPGTMSPKDIWIGNIDWFDIAVSGVIGGLTAGYGASISAGAQVSSFGSFIVANKSYVKLGEMLLTSAVDITGEGWQQVSLKDFGQRAAVGAATWGVQELTSGSFNKAPNFNESGGDVKELPKQTHHFATNKHSHFTREFENTIGKYNLDLDGDWNKEVMHHLGRHPDVYHQFVLSGMQRAAEEAGNDTKLFLKLYNEYVKKVVINNPLLLRKAGW